MAEKENIKFIPTMAKIIWYYTKLFLVIAIIFILIENVGKGRQSIGQMMIEWPILFCIFLLLFIILISRSEQKHNILELSSSGITGPSANRRNERVYIKFDDINIKKYNTQNIIQKLLGNRSICSNTKELIIITPEYYSTDQISVLNKKINK